MYRKTFLVFMSLVLVVLSQGSRVSAVSASNVANQHGAIANTQSAYYYELQKKLHPGGGATLVGQGSVIVDQGVLFVGDPETGGGKLYIFGRDQGGIENWGIVKTLSNTLDAGDTYFGTVAAFDSDTLVVGSYGYDDFHGAIFIFGRDFGGTNNWGLVKAIDGRTLSGDPSFYGSFGKSVAINGDTIVVGATFAYATGGAHILGRNQGGVDNWGQITVINDPYPGSPYTAFGESVAIDGDTVVIGAAREGYDGYSDPGAAYVYERDQGGADSWGQVGRLTGYLNHGVDFGTSLAIAGDTLVIGEPGFGYGSNPDFGAALVFKRNLSSPNHWEEVVRLFDPVEELNGRFGASLGIENDYIVVGGPGDSGVSTPPPGVAVVFERNEGGVENWGYTARVVDPEGISKDYFGSQVSLSDQLLTIGAQGDDDFGSGAGAVHIFEKQDYSELFIPLVTR